MKYIAYTLLALIALVIVSVVFKTCNTAGRFINNGIETTYQQFKPQELLRKYEWFKDASSQLDQKLATLNAYESRMNSLKSDYGEDSLRRSKWNRSDIEQGNIWQSEYLGVKASYNDLASQYNSAMSKFNYSFCNAGTLPQGALIPLPREFKPYINN